MLLKNIVFFILIYIFVYCNAWDEVKQGSASINSPVTHCEDENFYKCKESVTLENSVNYRSNLLQELFSRICIPKTKKCDGMFDCPEKDDEVGCNEIKCGTEQFKCPGFRRHLTSCIPKSWVCDGQSDCVNMEDEKNCGLKKNSTCMDDEFRCDDGQQCIYKNWRCNGFSECQDSSDEENCPTIPCNFLTQFQCEKSGLCIPKSLKCDGYSDCEDHSDEFYCSQLPSAHLIKCSENEFRCKNGDECIRKIWVCDGDGDCSDSSDEVNCSDHELECGAEEKMCDNGICRLNCDIHEPLPPKCDTNTHYQCNETNSCIPLSTLCMGDTGANDCLKSVCKLNITRCDEKESPYCRCRATFAGGKICYCPKGFQRSPGNDCVDIDECKQIPGICDQKCINLMGSYRCVCYPGFTLTAGEANADDEHIQYPPSKCRANSATSDPIILLSTKDSIRQQNLATKNYHPLIQFNSSSYSPSSAAINSMDFWYSKNLLFYSNVFKNQIKFCSIKPSIKYVCTEAIWPNNEQQKIEMCKSIKTMEKLECFEEEILIDEDIEAIDGLAIDWVHGLLFWTDTGLDTINVYDLNNKKRKILFNESLEEPRAIAVDPSAGLIFWTDWGSKGRIERAGMDGKNRVEVISGEAVKWPNGLAVDIYEKRIYWADAKTKAISSCDYWGGDLRTVLHSHKHLKHPFSLAVFEERLYWTDWDHEGVLTVNKFNGEDVKQVMNGVPGPMTVRVYHQMVQPTNGIINKCKNHGCEKNQICLPKALIIQNKEEIEEAKINEIPYSCICENGFKLIISSLKTKKCVPKNFIHSEEDFLEKVPETEKENFNNTPNRKSIFHYFTIITIFSATLSLISIIFVIFIAVKLYQRRKRFDQRRNNSAAFNNPMFEPLNTVSDGLLKH